MHRPLQRGKRLRVVAQPLVDEDAVDLVQFARGLGKLQQLAPGLRCFRTVLQGALHPGVIVAAAQAFDPAIALACKLHQALGLAAFFP